MKASEDGQYYKIDEYDEFISEALRGLPTVRKKKIDYYDVPCSFDIETTSFYYDFDGADYKGAIMYIWMFSLNGRVIIGRTWDELDALVAALEYDLKLAPAKRELICYVHNLSFEFQFIKDRFRWTDSFAMDMRRPIYAKSDKGITFKCSQFLSGTSLAQVGKNLTYFPVQKMEGDLDYSLIRNSKTELTCEEMQYCINDVLVLQSYIAEKIEIDGNITKIPLTKTGYVRKLCRDNCLYKDGDHKSQASGLKYLNYRKLINRTQLTPAEYKQAKRTYQGGFTHGNNFYTDKVIQGPVKSYDFTSSYPYCLVAFKYPMGKGESYEPESLEDIAYQSRIYWCMFDVDFEGLTATFPYEHYISKSRCTRITGETVDNGRVVEADRCLTSVTGEDWLIIQQTYTWKHVTIYNFKRYVKNYLPTDFVATVLDLYQSKTTLKGVKGKEIEYLLAKELLNSLYGMCVTDICRSVITYTDDWHEEPADIDDAIDRYNNSKSRFTSYLWGIACTAFARYNLWTGILELKEDYLYADTDSVKLTNYDKHKDYFESYNRLVDHRLKLACSYHGFPVELTRPKTIKGVEKMLGVWDDDGTYTRFKYLGAKRYMGETADGEMHLTVAGVGKKSAVRYLRAKYKTNDAIFEAFSDDLKIPAEYEDDDGSFQAAGKNTHTYIDREIEGYLTDYQGNTAYYHELSCVHLEATEYNLGLSFDYINYLNQIHCYAI